MHLYLYVQDLMEGKDIQSKKWFCRGSATIVKKTQGLTNMEQATNQIEHIKRA